MSEKSQNQIDKAINTYNQVEVETSVNGANPLQLIVLLYDGAIKNIGLAVDALLDQNFATKGRLVNRTIAILDGLRDALDFEKGGEIAQNLQDLYEYMKERLTLANLKNDPDIFAEVKKLLSELREAWAQLAEPGSAEKLLADHEPVEASELEKEEGSEEKAEASEETVEASVESALNKPAFKLGGGEAKPAL